MATTDPQVASSTTVTSSLSRGEKAKSALIGVRKFLEERLATDKQRQLGATPGSSQSAAPHTEAGHMALAGFKSGHFRREYSPGFLEQFANKYTTNRKDRGQRRKLNIITGPRAEKLYHSFIRRAQNEQKHPENAMSAGTKPIVFAFASNDKSSNGVNFYKTWRDLKNGGKNSESMHNVSVHQLGFLDSEFDQVLGFLDSEFHRMSVASAFSVVSLPYLQSLALDTGRSKPEEQSTKRPLRATNPDSSLCSGSTDEQPKSSEVQEKPLPLIDASTDLQDTSQSARATPDIIVSSPEPSSGPDLLNGDATSVTNTANGMSTPSSAKEENRTPLKESLSLPLSRFTGRRRKSRHRFKGVGSDAESCLTDASLEAGRSSPSGDSDQTEELFLDGPPHGSEFTIVLLEEGKDYSLTRHHCKHTLTSKTDAPEGITPWWAHLGRLPPSHPRAPQLFNPSSDDLPVDVSPWWTPRAEPSKKKKSRTPDKSEYRSRPHPEVGSTTWKEYMEPVTYPTPGIYDHGARLIEYEYAMTLAPEHFSPVGHYPSPNLYSIPHASPALSWGTYLDSSPVLFSDCSEYVSLPSEGLDSPIIQRIFTDATGYPYMPV